MQMLDAMREMHLLLRRQRSPEDSARSLGAPLERLAAYQGFVQNHVLSVLAKIYPTLLQVIGEPVWADLCRRYFVEVPATDYELNAAAEGLAAFIEEQAASNDSPLTIFHAELAVLEWAEFAAYVDPADAPRGELCPSRPRLNPTVQVLRFGYPVAEFLTRHRAWQRRPRGPAPAIPQRAGAAELVFVFRHPETLGYRYAIADKELLLAFKMAHDELSVAEIVALSELSVADVEALVGRAARLGLVLTATPASRGDTAQVKTSKQVAA